MNGPDLYSSQLTSACLLRGPSGGFDQGFQINIHSMMNMPVCLLSIHSHLGLVLQRHLLPHNLSETSKRPAKVCWGNNFHRAELLQCHESCGEVGRDLSVGCGGVIFEGTAETSGNILSNSFNVSINQYKLHM
jgi:hypothetical protein